MARKTEQVQKPSEEKTTKKSQLSNESEQLEFTPDQAASLLALQRTVGNRAVGELIQSRTVSAGHPAALHPQNISAGVIQLLRNGTVAGVHYEENPRDLISIRMRYQVESFDAILEGVNNVVGLFGSDRRYADNEDFQSGLRSYLTSINHPAARGGGPGMSLERWLRFRVQLLRGAGRRIDGIEFLEPFESVTMGEPEVEIEQPEPEEEAAPAETTPAARPVPGETAAEEAGEPEEERSLWSRIFSGIARREEWLSDLASARWLFNRLNAGMADFEREFVIIGEHPERLHTEERLVQPFLMASFTVLRTALGLADLGAHINPVTISMELYSRGARLLAGEYSFSDYCEDWWAMFRLHPGVAMFEQLRSAFQRLAAAYESGNSAQFWLGLSELGVAAFMTYSAIEGVRGGGAPERAAIGEAEAGATALPEAAATETAARPSGAAAETTARPSGAAAETPARPGSTSAESTARPSGTAAETTTRPAEAPTSGESGFSPEFQRWLREADVRAGATFEEARAEWTARMNQEMGAGESRSGRSPFDNPPYRVQEIIPDAQARQMIQQWARGELETPAHQALNHEMYIYEYREAGGWGRPPAGYIDSQGVFRFDHPESLGMPDIFHIRHQTEVASAVSRTPPEATASSDVLMDYYRRLLEERPRQPQGAQPAGAARPAGEQQAGAPPAEPVDVNAATGAGEAVDVEAATGAMEPPRAPGAQPGEPAGGQAAAAGPTRTMINRAAQQHGVQRVFYPEDVAEAQRFLEGVDRLNAPRMDLTPLGIRGRFARLVGMQAEVIAYLTDDGFFIYNKEVLSSPHSRP